MRYLSLVEVLTLHRQIIEQSGGAIGIRDIGLLESAIASGKMEREEFLQWLQCHVDII